MRPQHFRELDQEVVARFLEARHGFRADEPELRFAWSNWRFGTERLEDSAKRLQRNGIKYIELHGNLYGPDLGYRPKEVQRILGDHDLDPAQPHDVKVGRELLKEQLDSKSLPRLQAVVADRGYRGLGNLAAHHNFKLDIKAPPKGVKGFTPIAPLYRVEHAFARAHRPARKRGRALHLRCPRAALWAVPDLGSAPEGGSPMTAPTTMAEDNLTAAERTILADLVHEVRDLYRPIAPELRRIEAASKAAADRATERIEALPTAGSTQ